MPPAMLFQQTKDFRDWQPQQCLISFTIRFALGLAGSVIKEVGSPRACGRQK
jgi:hypothetical protein